MPTLSTRRRLTPPTFRALSALAALALALAAAPARAQEDVPKPSPTTTSNAPYSVDKTALEGKFIVPSPTPPALPLIVLFPDWMGVTSRATDDAKRLVAMGYAVFVADPYGPEARPKNERDAAKVSQALKADVVKLRKIAMAALETAKRQQGVDTNRVAAVGYCFGGTAALELARSGAPLRGVASVHGNLKTPFPDDARNISGRVLVLHGGADPHVPQAEVEAFKREMDGAGTILTFIEYPGALHAFTNPKAKNPAAGVQYDAGATTSAYGEMERFFADVLAAPRAP